MAKQVVLGMVIAGLITAVMLGALLPDIADDTIGVNQTATNITGATYTLNTLIPIILVIVVIVGLLAAAGIKVFG